MVRLSALVSRLEFEVTSLREENQGLKARNKELSNKVEDMSRGQQKVIILSTKVNKISSNGQCEILNLGEG